MSELGPEGSDLLEALRNEASGPDPKARVRARLAAAGVLGAAAGVPVLAAAQAPLAVLAKQAGWLGLTKLVLGTGALALAGLAVVSALDTRPAPDAPTQEVRGHAERAVARAPAPRVVPRAEPQPLAPAVPHEVPPARTRRRRARTTAETPLSVITYHTPNTPRPNSLAAESALVGRAVRALHDGDRETARALLREHTERFPHGLLARERALALERLGAFHEP